MTAVVIPAVCLNPILMNNKQSVSIADIYILPWPLLPALTAPLCHLQVINNFEHDGLSKYNLNLYFDLPVPCRKYLSDVLLLLNDGRVANIVMLNKTVFVKTNHPADGWSCIDTRLSLTFTFNQCYNGV